MGASPIAPATPLAPAPLHWRRRLPAVGSVAYVAVLAIAVSGGREPRAWMAALVASAVALIAAGRAGPVPRVAGWGLAVVVASLGAERGGRALDACGALGLLACSAAARVAIARIPSVGGVARTEPVSPVAGVVAIATAWCLAIVASLTPARGAGLGADPAAWVWLALAVNALVLVGSGEMALRRRRLELGFVERATAIRALLVTLVVAAVLVAVIGRGRADAMARLALGVAAVLVTGASLHPDPARVARAARRAQVLAIAGGSVALLGACAAAQAGEDGAWVATLVTGASVLAIGSAAGALESPLRPEGGRWLDAFARAADEAVRAEPDHAIRGALLALRAPAGLEAPSPELWTLAPARSIRVDAAGYLHESDGAVPPGLVSAAAAEPEATLCADVLEALEVRRPDTRPLARWLADRRAMLATVIADDGEVEGVLLLPAVGRVERPALEEVRALKLLANRLAVACRARGTQIRMLAREHEAVVRAEAAEQRADRLRHERDLDVGRDALAASRLARPATVGIYSAASRMALEALERRTGNGAPIAVVAPAGVDPVPYLARAHLAGSRAHGPIVLVDATSAREHDPSRWTDPAASPLALADRGMLVLLDGAALPQAVQRLVARASAEKRAPWERPDPLDIELALTAVVSPDELVRAGRLDPALASRLGDARSAPVALPRLRDRPDDLRAIVTDRLAREGLRERGRPVGIDHAAYALLAQYPFPGEDAELSSIVQRLVGGCSGDVVRAADVEALGLPPAGDARRADYRKDPLTA